MLSLYMFKIRNYSNKNILNNEIYYKMNILRGMFVARCFSLAGYTHCILY